jgi:hypothetical protein
MTDGNIEETLDISIDSKHAKSYSEGISRSQPVSCLVEKHFYDKRLKAIVAYYGKFAVARNQSSSGSTIAGSITIEQSPDMDGDKL